MSKQVENHIIDLLPDYVLELLPDVEASHVSTHLAACRFCQGEFARLQQVADVLPLALSQTSPSPRVKRNLMGAIHSPQSKTSTSGETISWKNLAGILRMRLPALGMALILVLALSNLLLWRQFNSLNNPANTSMRVIALANTNDAPQAVGTLIMGQNGDYGTLVVDHLPVLDAEQRYQVWLIHDGERISSGLFSVNYEGYGSLELSAPLLLNQYDSIGITIEPRGGSPGPTGAKVLGSDLPH